MLKKLLKGLVIGLFLLIAAGMGYIYLSVPSVSPDAEKIIERVIKEGPKDLPGQQGYVLNGEIKIWYEDIHPPDSIKGNIVLYMGIANDALAWPNYFLDTLLKEGYRLIRFDTRGTGMTDWMEGREKSYSLDDIAVDVITIMDTLDIEKAHMLGVSMGGMVAQTFAINYPDRTSSLISIMSSGYIMDPKLPGLSTSQLKDLVLAAIKYGIINTEKNQLKFQIVTRHMLMGEMKYEIDVEDICQTTLYNIRHRRGYNRKAGEQHSNAVIKSGSRYEALSTLNTKTLIIHGTDDPLMPFEHGKKCAELIPGADHLWIENMGHDIPHVFLEEIIEKISSHLDNA